MGNRRRAQGVRVKYAFLKAHRREFDTAVPIERWRISGYSA